MVKIMARKKVETTTKTSGNSSIIDAANNTAKTSALAVSDKASKIKSLFNVNLPNNSASIDNYKLPEGVVSVKSMIPGEVQAILKTQFESVGLSFDINSLCLSNANLADVLKQIRQTVDLIKKNASLLPDLRRELVSAMKAAKKHSDFNAKLVKDSLKIQHEIDENQADILLALTGYKNKSTTLDIKLEYKQSLIEKRHEAKRKLAGDNYSRSAEFIETSFNLVQQVQLEKQNTRVAKAEQKANREIDNEKWKQEIEKTSVEK